jgi:hypothetical protein
VSLSFCFKSPKFCAEGMFADKILWQVLEHSWWLCGTVGHFPVFSSKMLLWMKCCWINKYSICILTVKLTFVIHTQ